VQFLVNQMVVWVYRTPKSIIMETKKTNKANLERRRSGFFQVGLIIAVSLSLAAFEWLSPSVHRNRPVTGQDEIIPFEPTIIPEIEKQEPQKPEPKTTTTFLPDVDIIEVKNEVKVTITTLITDEIVDDPNITIGDPGLGDTGPVTTTVTEMPPLTVGEVDALPQFDYISFLGEHLRYPWSSRENKAEGIVYVEFLVTAKGLVEKVSVRGTKGNTDKDLEKEALRVVKGMPAWTPGMLLGQPVPVKLTIPIKFVLQD
jgi:protein TonB